MIVISIKDGWNEHEKEKLEKIGFVFLTDNYNEGCYEGEGHILACFGEDDWHYHNCGHCSCYGPIDDFEPKVGTGEPLEKLIASFSDDLKKECEDIIKVARKFEGGNNE